MTGDDHERRLVVFLCEECSRKVRVLSAWARRNSSTNGGLCDGCDARLSPDIPGEGFSVRVTGVEGDTLSALARRAIREALAKRGFSR